MTDEIDDSVLLHSASRYDPAKARAYYLRTRQLKGRRPGGASPPAGNGRAKSQSPPNSQRRSPSGGGAKVSPSQRQKMLAQKAALEKRLDRLREVLASLVDAAKKRSGVDTKTAKDKNSPEKKTPDKKLTPAERREKAKAAREAYKEEHQPVSQEVKQLQEQVQDVLAQIKAAAADAQRQRSSQSKSKTANDRR